MRAGEFLPGIRDAKCGRDDPRDMVDPTSDLGEEVSEDDAPRCETCGDPIVDEPRHRVVTWIEDGEVRTAHFCDDDCRAEWDD